MVKFRRLTILFLLLLLVSSQSAIAEFSMVNPLFRHFSSSKDGSAGVIILPEGNNEGIYGLFFYYSKEPISAQGFTLNKIPADAQSIFLKFDASGSRKFNELTVSSGKKYSVSGNLTISMGTLRITVHDENQADQYVSAVLSGDQGALGFVGLQLVSSLGMSSKTIKFIQPKGASDLDTFEVKNGNLNLGNIPFEGTKIGLGYGGGSNPCVSNGVQILTRAQYVAAQKGDKKSLAKKNFYTKNTLLFSESAHVVAIDGYGQLLIIKPEAEKLSDGSLICVADYVREDS